jgi:hypothetical protein
LTYHADIGFMVSLASPQPQGDIMFGPYRSFTALLTIIFLIGLLPSLVQANTLGPDEPRLSPPSKLDEQYLQQQRQRISSLFGLKLGRGLKRDQRDLEGLQLLLDRRLVAADDPLLLQAMGIVMGDALLNELGMHWVIYEDKQGRSRALQLGKHREFLFPATMISRRYQAGARVDVQQIYDRAAEPLRPLASADPFD